MPCYQSTNLPSGFTTAGRTGYATEADCLQACREGACCEGTTCTVKPQCQCQGAEKTFKGVGATCESFNGACCEDGPVGTPPTCSIKTVCECVGEGKSFGGVGSTCATASCCISCQLSGGCPAPMCIPKYIVASFSATTQEYVAFIFNELCRVPSLTVGGAITLTGYVNNTYPCGSYTGTYEGAPASPLNGSAVYAQVSSLLNTGFLTVRKKAIYGSLTNGVRSLSLSNDWPIVPASQYIDFTFQIPPPAATTAFLQNGSSGYCYGVGTAPLLWVQYSQTAGEFLTDAGSISVTSSYGAGVRGL